MNARETLHDFLGTERWSDHDTALLDGLIDNYAHGLAEGIRENLEHCDEPDGMDRCCGVAASADHIDPEVEK